jgi:hypothetical protein
MNSNSTNSIKKPSTSGNFGSIMTLISIKDIIADSSFTVIPWIILLLIIGIIIII